MEAHATHTEKYCSVISRCLLKVNTHRYQKMCVLIMIDYNLFTSCVLITGNNKGWWKTMHLPHVPVSFSFIVILKEETIFFILCSVDYKKEEKVNDRLISPFFLRSSFLPQSWKEYIDYMRTNLLLFVLLQTTVLLIAVLAVLRR